MGLYLPGIKLWPLAHPSEAAEWVGSSDIVICTTGRCNKAQAKLRSKSTGQLKPFLLPSRHTGVLWEWAVPPECFLERVLNWIWTENHFELLFFHLRPHRKLLWWFCWSCARMSKHWLFWFRITEQDLTASPGTFLHENSLLLAGSEPHGFRHSSAFPSVFPKCALWCCFALQTFAAGCSPQQLFHLSKLMLLTGETCQFFYSTVWNVLWDYWDPSVSAPSNFSTWIHPWVQLRSQI